MAEIPVCHPTDTLDVAARLCFQEDVSSVLVVDFEGCVLGVVSDRCICAAAYRLGLSLDDILVADAMRSEFVPSLHLSGAIAPAGQGRLIPITDGQDNRVGLVWLETAENGSKKRRPRKRSATRKRRRRGERLALLCG